MLRSFAIQALIFFVAFQVLSFLRETSMLSTDVSLDDIASLEQSVAKPVEFNNIPSLTGELISLNSDGKTTVLYFFAPWCQVCHVSIGNLQSLFEQNENIDVIAVALDFTNTDEVMKFTSQHQLTFPIALGNERLKQSFEISGYPSYYVINTDNVIVAKSMGYSSKLGLYLRAI